MIGCRSLDNRSTYAGDAGARAASRTSLARTKEASRSISSKEVTLSQSLRAKPSRKGGMNIGANQLGVVFTPAVQSDVVNYRTGARATTPIPSRHPGHPVASLLDQT